VNRNRLLCISWVLAQISCCQGRNIQLRRETSRPGAKRSKAKIAEGETFRLRNVLRAKCLEYETSWGWNVQARGETSVIHLLHQIFVFVKLVFDNSTVWNTLHIVVSNSISEVTCCFWFADVCSSDVASVVFDVWPRFRRRVVRHLPARRQLFWWSNSNHSQTIPLWCLRTRIPTRQQSSHTQPSACRRETLQLQELRTGILLVHSSTCTQTPHAPLLVWLYVNEWQCEGNGNFRSNVLSLSIHGTFAPWYFRSIS